MTGRHSWGKARTSTCIERVAGRLNTWQLLAFLVAATLVLKMAIVKGAGRTVYIVLLLYLAGLAIGSAAREHMLIPVALPFAAALVLAARVLGPRTELAAWAVLTVWLGSTYLQTGATRETVAFVVYAGLALLGAFKSPYVLAAAWLLHPLWDFVPRELPALLTDLPAACILFDVPIGLYLLWNARKGRWRVFGAKTSNGRH